MASALQRIARNAASVLLGSAAGEILTGYALVLAAVTLGPGGFGELNSAQALMEPFLQLAGFGLSQVVVAEAALRGGSDGTLRGTTLGIRLPLAFVASGSVLLLAATTGRVELLPLLGLLAISTVLTQVTAVALMPFEFGQTMHKPIAFPFLASVVRLGTAYLAVWFLARPIGFQLSGLAAGLTSAVLHVWLSSRAYPAAYRFDWALGKRLLVAAWPVAAIQFVSMWYMRGSYFLLHEAGPQVLGEYAAADRLVRPILTIGAVFMMSSLPTLSTFFVEQKYDTLVRAYRTAVARTLAIALPALAAAWVAGPWLLRRFAPDYAGATWPFRMLAIGTVFMILNHLSGVFVYAMRRQKLIMWVALANCAVYFSLALVLIPQYQATGAAAATMVMEGVNTAIQMTIVWVLLRRSGQQGKKPGRALAPEA